MSDRPPDNDPDGHADPESTIPTSSLAATGQTLGPYLLRERVGTGGMGEVWKAEQTHPVRRTVALKLIKAGMDSREVLARFEAERQALALMDHPCIAKVFDAGTTPQGRPYFAMEYVQGVPITEYCDKRRLSTVERLRLFQLVCQGVQHAHQKAVLHRDLKPSNVLVYDIDGKPSPKIIDFGVAKATTQKLTEKTMYTAMGQLIGTPEYMSPEQADLTGEDVDTRTDVYSLGVVLYQLLVGALPFDSKELRKAGFEGIRRIIREKEPQRPSTKVTTLGGHTEEIAKARRTAASRLSGQLRGDLDWITMRALEKDRNRRYASPQDLAADIGRHLRHEPVLAGPPTAGYRAGKFVRRHRVGVGIAAVTFVVLVSFAATMAVQSQRIAAERDRANQEAEASERVSAFLADMLGDVNPERFGNALLYDLEARVAESHEQRGLPADEVDAVRVSLKQSLKGVNIADFAREVLDAEILDRADQHIGTDFHEDPLIAARLHHTLGESYRELGLSEKAESQSLRAYEIRRRELGEEHTSTLASLQSAISVQVWPLGKLDEADSLNSKVLRICSRTLGEDHPQTLRALEQRAWMLHLQLQSAGSDPAGPEHARWAQVDSLYQFVLTARQRVLGPAHEKTLETVLSMADMHRHMSRLDERELMLVQGFETCKRVFGEDHEESISFRREIAGLYFDLNRLREAEEMGREFLAVSERVFGREHWESINAMYGLARTLMNRGSYPESEILYKEILDYFERRRGINPSSARSYLVSLYQNWKRYDDAEQLETIELSAHQQIHGAQDKRTAWAMGKLATIHVELGRHEEAERRFLEAIDILREALGPEHEWYLDLSSGLAKCYQSWGRLAEAESWHRRTLETCHRVLGETHDLTLESIEGLARLLLDAGRPEEARVLLEELVAASRQATTVRRTQPFKIALDGNDEKGPATARDRHARLLIADYLGHLRNPQEALTYALEANEISGYVVPQFLNTLARTYHLTDQGVLAVETQRKALDLVPVEVNFRRDAYQAQLQQYEAAASEESK